MLNQFDTFRYQYATPQFELVCAGVPAVELRAGVSSLEVVEGRGSSNTFTAQLQDVQLDTGGLRWLDDPCCQPGATWQVSLGYLAERRLMVDGHLTSVSVSFNDTLGPNLTLTGADRAQKALAAPVRGLSIAEEITDAQLVRRLAKHVGLTAVTDATEGARRHSTVSGSSVRARIDGLAKTNGFEWFLAGRTLHFKRPGSRLRLPVPGLTWGKNLLSLSASLNVADCVSAVTVEAHNREDGSPIRATARAGSERRIDQGGGPTGSEIIERNYGKCERVIADAPMSSLKEAEARARAELEQASGGINQVSCTVIGDPSWQPGMQVNLEGVGRGWLRGTYEISRVGHSVSAQGYRCSLTLERNSA